MKCDCRILEDCGHGHLSSSHEHCQFDMWAPGPHTSIENLAFSAYAEQQEKIEEFIAYLVHSHDPNDDDVQYAAEIFSHIRIEELADDEIDYIKREVERRWLN